MGGYPAGEKQPVYTGWGMQRGYTRAKRGPGGQDRWWHLPTDLGLCRLQSLPPPPAPTTEVERPEPTEKNEERPVRVIQVSPALHTQGTQENPPLFLFIAPSHCLSPQLLLPLRNLIMLTFCPKVPRKTIKWNLMKNFFEYFEQVQLNWRGRAAEESPRGGGGSRASPGWRPCQKRGRGLPKVTLRHQKLAHHQPSPSSFKSLPPISPPTLTLALSASAEKTPCQCRWGTLSPLGWDYYLQNTLQE
jgi:hypothetical protein